jgi:hypothetical protein
MITAVADTHSIIWYLANDARLGDHKIQASSIKTIW